jgi:F-type H+-transporting ATPase subunit a
MGPKLMYYAPYIGTLLVFALLGALVSLIGLRSMTADINVTGTWALMTFALITFHKIKANGFGGYLKSFGKPVAFILPLNIVSEIATPASMAFRLFGNVAGGMVITSLLYGALAALSQAVGLSFAAGSWGFSVFQVGIPAVLSVYFDLFSGCIQAYIFSMLTMVNVGTAAEEE